MSDELYLPSNFIFTPNPSVREPAIWIRRLLLLKKFAPGEANVIRDISLRRGLNILWAKAGSGAAGHAAGKTTFCRLLRFALGEEHFGNKRTQAKIRKHFTSGRVAAEVLLNGTPWVVTRPFPIGPHSQAARNTTLDQLFEAPLTDEGWEAFQKELQFAALGGLKIRTFAASGHNIELPHLLPWLARDQESRFRGLVEWRDSASDSKPVQTSAEDRHHLLRVMLDLLSPQEQKELETNARLVSEKDVKQKDEPSAGYHFRKLRRSLNDNFSNAKTPDLDAEDFTDQVKALVVEELANVDATFAGTTDDEPVKRALGALQDAGAVRTRAEDDLRRAESYLKGLEDERKSLLSDQPKLELEDGLTESKPGRKFCDVPLEEAALKGCWLSTRHAVSLKAEMRSQDAKAVREDLESREIPAAHERVKAFQSAFDTADKDAKTANADYETKRKARENAALMHTNARQYWLNYEVAALAVRVAHDDVKALEKSIEELDTQIKDSYDEQERIRQSQLQQLSHFTEVFDYIVREVISEDREVRGFCRFAGREIEPVILGRNEMTSAAIDTIAYVTLDLAAVAHSIQGRGSHPRFLLHDGPREADLALDIYHRLFDAARTLEKHFPDDEAPFQYIITTTEAPPESVKATPWLIINPPLDAAVKEHRLLGEDL